MSGFSNILLVQLGDIGDAVLTSPTIRATKETHPDARVSILVRKPFGSLFLADPNLYEVIESEKIRSITFRTLRELLLFARRLRRAQYDLVVDLRTGDRGAILSYLTGAQERIGLREDNKPFWYKHLFTKLLLDPPYAPLPVHPGARQSLRIVREIGIETEDSTPKLYVAPKDREHVINLLEACKLTSTGRWATINPCSRWKYKEWSYEKWGEVVDWLWIHHQLPTLLVGSLEEDAAAGRIVGSRSDHAFNLTGKTTLGQLSALLSMSTLHLGVDSAAPHIAAAVGTPTLTIFGPGNWKSWTIEDALHRIVTADMQCIPCNRKGCDDSEKSRCLDELETERICAEAGAILSVIDNRGALAKA